MIRRVLVLLLLGAACLRPVLAETEVWYVPGWLRCHAPDALAWNGLTNAFPSARCVFWDWDGNRGWGQSVTNADRAVDMLVDRLAALSVDARTNLTLVGHSLGGRIVVKTLARLAERDLAVARGVVFAAALPADDAALKTAGRASVNPVVLLNNPGDFTLRFAYRASRGVHGPALGLVGPAAPAANVHAFAVSSAITRETDVPAHWGQVELFKKLAAHHAVFYLEELRRRREEVLK